MRRLAPRSSRSSASAIEPCSVQRATHELARLRRSARSCRPGRRRSARSARCARARRRAPLNSRSGSAEARLQRGQVGRREAAVGERGQQGLGLGGVRAAAVGARARRAVRARRRARARRRPPGARAARRRRGPAGRRPPAGSAGSSGCSAARRSSCSRARVAQLGVARRRQPAVSAPGRAQHLARLRTARPAPPSGRRRVEQAGRRDLRERQRPRAPPAERRARATARRRRPAGAGDRAHASPPPWRGGAGSSTRPPATVACGAVVRTITRSPRAAATSSRRRSCARPAEPAASALGLEQRDARLDAGRADQHLHERAVRDAGPARAAPAARRRAGSSREARPA